MKAQGRAERCADAAASGLGWVGHEGTGALCVIAGAGQLCRARAFSAAARARPCIRVRHGKLGYPLVGVSGI